MTGVALTAVSRKAGTATPSHRLGKECIFTVETFECEIPTEVLNDIAYLIVE